VVVQTILASIAFGSLICEWLFADTISDADLPPLPHATEYIWNTFMPLINVMYCENNVTHTLSGNLQTVILQNFKHCVTLPSTVTKDKRHREIPRRPWIIWAFDTSKQALAAFLVHFSNVLISYVAGENPEGSSKNPCVWYVSLLFYLKVRDSYIIYPSQVLSQRKLAIFACINRWGRKAALEIASNIMKLSVVKQILLDTTIGVGILYIFLKVLHAVADFLRISDMKSGHYGNPPRYTC
jgi:hypothetical protein